MKQILFLFSFYKGGKGRLEVLTSIFRFISQAVSQQSEWESGKPVALLPLHKAFLRRVVCSVSMGCPHVGQRKNLLGRENVTQHRHPELSTRFSFSFWLHYAWHSWTRGTRGTRNQTCVPPAVELRSLNHWTTREVPSIYFSRLNLEMVVRNKFFKLRQKIICLIPKYLQQVPGDIAQIKGHFFKLSKYTQKYIEMLIIQFKWGDVKLYM